MAIVTMDMSSYEYSCEGAVERAVQVCELEWGAALGLQVVTATRREAGYLPASLVGVDVGSFLARMDVCQP